MPFTTGDTATRLQIVGDVNDGSSRNALSYFRSAGLPLASFVASMFDQSDDCIKLLDLDGCVQFMNCNGRMAMEIAEFADIADTDWTLFWPAGAQATARAAVASARSGSIARFEAFCPTMKGSPRWWDVTLSPICADDGTVAALLSWSRDVTDRRQREDSMATIAAEMSHRLRNAYTVSSALASAAAREAPEYAQFAGELIARLQRVADAQAQLQEASGSAGRLDGLVHRVTDAFATAAGTITIAGVLPDVDIGDGLGRAVALALGELCTNSIKYGALGKGGCVTIAGATALGDDGAGTLRIDWTETTETTAATIDRPRPSGGSGMGLMARMMRLHGGSFTSNVHVGGVDAVVTMPLAHA